MDSRKIKGDNRKVKVKLSLWTIGRQRKITGR
jgi:hypothetical protein